ncbi:hypothetical protein MUK42_34791 [Musa troglodytarum]|uniref:Uncharacterized protein n=1 Tax=Musa troglodytarum TaxID=320322 RepID=A0A9E7EDL2_9LILI|nr:hypothetical protein MUK42_34791 [Musa troglodytarum]
MPNEPCRATPPSNRRESRGIGAGFDRHTPPICQALRIRCSQGFPKGIGTEHGFDAGKTYGIASIGVRGKDFVCLSTQKKVSVSLPLPDSLNTD